MARFPWLRLQKKTDPELPLEPPIWFGNHSNGEYFHFATKRDRTIRRMILETADQNARKLNIDRRDFLASAMGMCTSLWVLNQVACSSTDAKPAGLGDGGGADSAADAKFCVPKESMLDESLACGVIAGDEFIFDVQTHWFKKTDLAQFPGYL